jgi:hypothetical protein
MKSLAIGCLSLVAAFASAQNSLLTNLQACYPLDCVSGSLTANSASTGAAFDGTVQGNVTCTPGHLGTPSTALQFGGTPADIVILPKSPLIKPTNSITVTGWFYVPNSGYQSLVFVKTACGSTEPGYTLGADNGKFGIIKYSACSTGSGVTSPAYSMNAWHFVVAYFDNKKLSVRVDNGTPATLSHSLAFSYEFNKSVILGGTDESWNFPFSGKMDNLRFYNRELTPAEITKLYTLAPLCTDEGLAPVTSYTMSRDIICEGEFTEFADESGNTPTSWLWEFEGGSPSSSPLNTPTVSFATSGMYTVSLVASNNYGSGPAVVQMVTVNVCTGSDPNAFGEQKPVIVPNPAADRFSIDHVTGCDVRISDLSGRVVELVSANSEIVEIDCSDYPAGVYTVAVRNSFTGASTVLKVVLCGSH